MLRRVALTPQPGILPGFQPNLTSTTTAADSLLKRLQAKQNVPHSDFVNVTRSLWDEALSHPNSSIDSDYTRDIELYGDIAIALMDSKSPLDEATSNSAALMIAFLSKNNVRTTNREERYETPRERTFRHLVANEAAKHFIELGNKNPFKVDRIDNAFPSLRGLFPVLLTNQIQVVVSNYAYDWRYRNSSPYTLDDTEARIIPLEVPANDLRDYNSLITDTNDLLLNAMSLLNRAIEAGENVDQRTPGTYLSNIITLADFPNFDLADNPKLVEEVKILGLRNKENIPRRTLELMCKKLREAGFTECADEIGGKTAPAPTPHSFIVGPSGGITFPPIEIEMPQTDQVSSNPLEEEFLNHLRSKRFEEAAILFQSDLDNRAFTNEETVRAQTPLLMRELSRSGKEVLACRFARACLAHNLLVIDSNTMEQTQSVALRANGVDARESAFLLIDGINKGLKYRADTITTVGKEMSLDSSADLKAFSDLTTTAIRKGICLPNCADSTRFIFTGIAILGKKDFDNASEENILDRVERYKHAREIAFALTALEKTAYSFPVTNLNGNGERNVRHSINYLISNQIENAEKLLRNYFLIVSKRRLTTQTKIELNDREAITEARLPGANPEVLRNEAYESIITSLKLMTKAVELEIPIDLRSLNAALSTANTFVDFHTEVSNKRQSEVAHIALDPHPNSKEDEEHQALALAFADAFVNIFPIMSPDGGLPDGISAVTLDIYLRNLDNAGRQSPVFKPVSEVTRDELEPILHPEKVIAASPVSTATHKLVAEPAREVKKPSPGRFEPKTYGKRGGEIDKAIQRMREKDDLEGALELLARSLEELSPDELLKISRQTVEATICAGHKSPRTEDRYRAAIAVRRAIEKKYSLNSTTIMQTGRFLIERGAEHKHYLAYGNILLTALKNGQDQNSEDIGIVIDKLSQPILKPDDKNPLALYERLSLASDITEVALQKGYNFSKLHGSNAQRVNFTLLALCGISARLCLWEQKDDLPQWAAFQLTHELNRTLSPEEVDRIKALEVPVAINPKRKASELAARAISLVAIDEERKAADQNPIHEVTLKKVFLLLDNLNPDKLASKDYYLFMRRTLANESLSGRLHTDDVENIISKLLERTDGDLQENAELALAVWELAHDRSYLFSELTTDELYTRTAHLEEKKRLYEGGPNLSEIRTKELHPIIERITRDATPLEKAPDTATAGENLSGKTPTRRSPVRVSRVGLFSPADLEMLNKLGLINSNP